MDTIKLFQICKVFVVHAVKGAFEEGFLTGPSLPESRKAPVIAPKQVQPVALASGVETPTTAETVAELKRRLGKELYKVELDLLNGGRIAGKPCDCLSKAKHSAGLEAAAEELMSYEANPLYSRIINWMNSQNFDPAEIAKHPPEYYQSMAPEIRNFRKAVMGTEKVTALLNEQEQARLLQLAGKK